MHDPGLNFDLGDTIDSLRDAIATFAAAEIALQTLAAPAAIEPQLAEAA